jgi:glycosyltransferase involved in cell wall biosynthesis
VVDGTTGLLVTPGQPKALARRIRKLLANPMLLEGFGIASADRAQARYNWERIGRETIAQYSKTQAPVVAPVETDADEELDEAIEQAVEHSNAA